jgi:hypothetical protein
MVAELGNISAPVFSFELGERLSNPDHIVSDGGASDTTQMVLRVLAFFLLLVGRSGMLVGLLGSA